MEFSAPVNSPVIQTTRRMHVHIVQTDTEPLIALYSSNSPSERNLRFSVPCLYLWSVQFPSVLRLEFPFLLKSLLIFKVRVCHCTIQYIHSRTRCYQAAASLQSGLKSQQICARSTAQGNVSCNISCSAKDIIKIMILYNGCIIHHSAQFTVETISQ